MKRKLCMLLLAGMISVVTFGCSKAELQPEEDISITEESEEITDVQRKKELITNSAYAEADGIELEKGAYISIIGKTNSTEFFKAVKAGVEAAGEDLNTELGYEGDDVVRVAFHAPSSYENVDDQVNLLDEELALYPEALGISIVDQKACDVQFDLAKENDIPIIAFDSGNEYKGIEAMVSTDNYAAARESASRMAEILDEKGKVVVFVHDMSTESGEVRVKEFKKELKENHPGVQAVKVYSMKKVKDHIAEKVNHGKYVIGQWTEKQKAKEAGEEYTEEKVTLGIDGMIPEDDRIKGADVSDKDIVEYMVSKHPKAKGFYATNAETLECVIQGLDELGVRDKKLIGYDVNDTIVDAIDNGKVEGVVLQNPFGMGYAAVIAAARASLDMGNEAEIDTGYVWLDKTNKDSEEMLSLMY